MKAKQLINQTLIVLFLIISGCKSDLETIAVTQESAEPSALIQDLKTHFCSEEFTKSLPAAFSINWDATSKKEYSKILSSDFIEIPIECFEQRSFKKGNFSRASYSIIAIPQLPGKKSRYQFFIAKYTVKNKSGLKPDFSKVTLKNLSTFSGLINLFDSTNSLALGLKIDSGDVNNTYYTEKYFPSKEKTQNKMFQDCYTSTVYHYTDWYTSDGRYTNSTLDYISYETVCYSTFIPELSSTGGGGAGTYYSSGSGSTYADCGDPVHGCLFKLKDKVATADTWENEEIDDSKLAPCMKSILSDLKNLNTGVGQIVAKFSGNTPGYNWKVQVGDLEPGINAETKASYNPNTGTVTTTFDINKFRDATDLSIARTILHEAIHAYVVAVTYNVSSLEEKKELLGPNWINVYINHGHPFIADKYQGEIAKSLELFGIGKGYSNSFQFYSDLSWGGLTTYKVNNHWVDTPWFKAEFPDNNVRDRIKDVISVEQSGYNESGTKRTQKGNNAGC